MISINNNKKLLEGFFTVCDAVSQTMGAQGKLAVMENELIGNPIVTKDGISTAKRIFFKDGEKNIGANLAKQVAAKTLVTAGDSTTTSLVLAKALVESVIVKKGFFKPADFFYNKRVEKGMELAYEDVCKALEFLSKPITDEIIKRIATVSANNNDLIGNLVYKAYKEVGSEGIIDVRQNHNSPTTELEVSKGMKLTKGWADPQLINNQSNAKFEADDALVLVYEGYLDGDAIVQDFLTENQDKPIVILAERFHDDTIMKLGELNKSGVLNITAIPCPEYDKKRVAILNDVALYTGGEVYRKGSKNVEIVTGKVDRVVVDEGSCSFIKEKVPNGVKELIINLKSQLETVNDKEWISKRIQQLEGVTATIVVGGVSESEIKEKFDRVEDAVCSVQSAVKEGWIAGGGSTLNYISRNYLNKKMASDEIQFGYDALARAIREPFRRICINSRRSPEKYINRASKMYGFGYNASTDMYSNLVEDSIIDSTRSIRTALENSLSVSKLLLNTSVVITHGKD